MSEIQNHKIHTASLQVDFEGLEEGLGVQDSLGLLFYEKIKPALEKTFDNYGDPKATIVFDKLELDCGHISYENWEENLVKQVLIQLDENLKSVSKEKNEIIPVGKKAEEVFIHFLKKGYFPWNSPFANPRDLEDSVVLEPPFLEKLRFVFLKSPALQERFFHAFSSDFISKVVSGWSLKLHPDVTNLVSFLDGANLQEELFQVLVRIDPEKKPFSLTHFLENLITNFSLENLTYLGEYLAREVDTGKELRKEMKTLVLETNPPELQRKIPHLMQSIQKRNPSFWKEVGFSLEEVEFLKGEFLQKKIGKHNSKPLNQKDFPKSQPDPRPMKRPNPSPNQLGSKEQEDQEIKEGIFVENAGLVLLHPFLAGLFGNLQLTENGKFVAESDQSLAARMLQFLVFGENELSENFYPLNKILCGMGVSQVLGVEIDISQEFKIEGEELLQAVIGHWSFLKNTSIDGLRETFLQRNGKISRVEKGWKLQVERKTVDVLLAKLPWGLGIIKLPWMNDMMFVEWE
ncbi:contractile injection system tape measure protein [Cognataquiflexum rubidum]|uniref:contractile injection system tape measure protein n=1 Tax=Cognataquiflexum rubidum TaxID=2922273 RepID=UPI001F1400EC|nr:contractile injection system tape measure protein [Cognataquiflexum rubidum]MCH6236261.1 contractile injection system tape measure protein [Cognataquiflexum rubidum]